MSLSVWKLVLVAVVFIVAVAVVVCWKSNECYSAQQQCNAAEQLQANSEKLQNGNSGTIEAEANKDKKKSADDVQQTCNRANVYLCTLLAPANLPSIILILIGIGGVTVGVGTLVIVERQTLSVHHQAIQVKRQTKLIRKSAEAALLTAQAAVNSDRPLLVIEIREALYEPGEFIVFAKNTGKTAAYLEEGLCDRGARTLQDSFPNVDKMLPFSNPVQPLTLPQTEFLIDRFRVDWYLGEDTEPSPKRLYSCGILKYWDMFTERRKGKTEPYITQWCFQWNKIKSTWDRSANDYSKNT